MKLFILFPLFFISVLCFSQTNINIAKDSIYKKGGSWRMNGEKLNSKQLKTEIYKVPEAIVYYKKARKNIWTSVGSMTWTFGALLFIPEYKRNQYPNKVNYLRYVAAGTGIGLQYYFLFKHNSNLRKAIKTHNQRRIFLY